MIISLFVYEWYSTVLQNPSVQLSIFIVLYLYRPIYMFYKCILLLKDPDYSFNLEMLSKSQLLMCSSAQVPS